MRFNRGFPVLRPALVLLVVLSTALTFAPAPARLGGMPRTAEAATEITLTNDADIIMPHARTDFRAATPYPSNITVSGLTGAISGVRVGLNGLTHTRPDDIDIMLVGPLPEAPQVILMSDAGGDTDVAALDLTFTSTGNDVPDATALASGPYYPTNYGTGDVFSSRLRHQT